MRIGSGDRSNAFGSGRRRHCSRSWCSVPEAARRERPPTLPRPASAELGSTLRRRSGFCSATSIGRPTAEQIRERGRGPGSSMGYDLQDGTSHRLTNLRRSSPVPRWAEVHRRNGRADAHRDGDRATDEPRACGSRGRSSRPPGSRGSTSRSRPATGSTSWEPGSRAHRSTCAGAPSSSRSPTAATGRSSRRSTSRRPATAFSTGRARSVTCSSQARTTARSAHLASAAHTPACPIAAKPDRIQACFKARALTYEVYAGSPMSRSSRPTRPPLGGRGCRRRRSSR